MSMKPPEPLLDVFMSTLTAVVAAALGAAVAAASGAAVAPVSEAGALVAVCESPVEVVVV